MWMLMILAWRMLAKLVRRLGRGLLLLPVAVMGAAVFGLNAWTAATVVLALILAVLFALVLAARRSPASASVLPLGLLGAGLCGLWVAATRPGMWGAGSFNLLGGGIAVESPVQVRVPLPPSAFQKVAPPSPARQAGAAWNLPVYGSPSRNFTVNVYQAVHGPPSSCPV